MKTAWLKKLTAALCVSVMSFVSVGGCGSQSESENKETVVSETDKKFVFVAHATPTHKLDSDPKWGLLPEMNTEKNWRIIKDCGFNYAMPVADVNESHIISTLENAQKQGIKVLIMDHMTDGLPFIVRAGENKSYAEVYDEIKSSEERLKKHYDSYKKYSSFAGVVIIDEPSAAYYEAIAAGQDWWRENYPDYEYYCNLLPSYASYGQLFGSGATDGAGYADYVDTYVQKVNPQYISFDHYSLLRQGMSGTVRPTWLYDIETIAESAKKYDIPWYAYLLSTGHWNYMAPETYAEFAWQAYSCMAYGVSGLQTFRYWSYQRPDKNADKLGTGFVDEQGNPTPLYYAAQTVISEIKAMESVYMNFKWQKTMPIGLSGNGSFSLLNNPAQSLKGIKSAEASADSLLSLFKDEKDNYAYFAMNYASPYSLSSSDMKIEFVNCKQVMVLKKGRRLIYDLNNGTLDLNLGSGEGCMIIPLN